MPGHAPSFIGNLSFKSGRDVNKLEGLNYRIGETEAPIMLDNAVACLEARVVNRKDVGDHTVFVGEVVASEVISGKACLTYLSAGETRLGAHDGSELGRVKEGSCRQNGQV